MSLDVRALEQALVDAGDPAAAGVWRHAARRLVERPTVVVLGTDGAVAGRLARALGGGGEVGFDAVVLSGGALDPGVEDRLLGAHAVVWATPFTAPLGAEERRLMTELVASGAPSTRLVVVANLAALASVSDDPEGERQAILTRVRHLVPAGWSLVDEADAKDQLGRASAHTERIEARRVEVARRLVGGARDAALRRAGEAAAQADAARVSAEACRADAGGALRTLERVSAHVLASVRRRSEGMLLELAGFFDGLHADVGPQIAAVSDVGVARRGVAPWLQHVVEGAIRDAVADWRAGVLADLDEVDVDRGALDAVGMVVPMLHPGAVRDDAGWSTARIGATATLGGGVVLFLAGLWLPAVAAVGGGVVWGALAERAASENGQERLIEAARGAVRRLARDADAQLRAQLATMEVELARLADARAAGHEAAATEQIAAWAAREQAARNHEAAARATVASLDARWAALEHADE
jgi:hypothetical protein